MVGSLAFKIARGERGRRCNRYEAKVYRQADADRQAKLCPALWCSPFGIVLVARAAVPLTPTEFEGAVANGELPDWHYRGMHDEPDPFEGKPSDWGYLDGKIVALDYAAPALFPDETQA